jgi:signal transduction histidine kinase
MHAVSTCRRVARDWWPTLSLARKFALVSSAVVLGGMVIIGSWVAMQVEHAVRHNVASSTAIYMDSFVTPLLQDLVKNDSLSATSETALDALMHVAAVNMRVVAIKIWGPRGLLLYSSNDKGRVGTTFKVKEELRGAWGGVVTSSFQNMHRENRPERAIGAPLLEVYAPVHDPAGRVMAVAEFYQSADVLRDEIMAAQRDAWIVTGLVALLMVAMLFIVVSDGSQTISDQAAALRRRVNELSQLLDLNETLRGRLQEMSKLAAAENERFLRRVGTDLRDGPSQLISFALLRLDSLDRPEDREAVRSALQDSLADIRSLSAGMFMPAAAGLSLGQALRHIAEAHQERTSTKVAVEIRELPEDMPELYKVGLCRFVEEALNNAVRHPGSKGPSLRAWTSEGAVFVQVTDHGRDLRGTEDAGERFGLAGLAGRLEGLGGTLQIVSAQGRATQLTARVPLRPEGG